MNREVSFSFDSEDQKDVFRTMARKRGQTLSQFARWCVFKYSQRLENLKRVTKHDQICLVRGKRKRERGHRAIHLQQEKMEGCGFVGSGRSLSINGSLPFSEKAKVCFYCGLPATEREHTIPRTILRTMSDVGIGSIVRGRKLIVSACRECNTLLGSSYQQDLKKRKRFLKTRLRKKYKSLLNTKSWAGEELKEMGPSLQSQILSGLQQKKVIKARLAW